MKRRKGKKLDSITIDWPMHVDVVNMTKFKLVAQLSVITEDNKVERLMLTITESKGAVA